MAGDTDNILKRLQAKFPATQIDSVSATPLAGIYEIRMGGNVAYTDATTDVWMFGHLYDMRTSRDITADRLVGIELPPANKTSASSQAPAQWPIEGAIVRVKGDGRKKLYLVSDTDCVYCRKLEGQLALLDNITIYTFPVALMGDSAKANAAWCASDRAAAWELVMSGARITASAPCITPIRDNTAKAVAAGVRGTPTLIREDGERLSGYADARRIDAWLTHNAR